MLLIYLIVRLYLPSPVLKERKQGALQIQGVGCVKYEVLAHVTCTSRNLLNVVGTLIRKFLINITKTICVQIFKNLAKLMVY